MSELKLCPFCGAVPKYKDNDYADGGHTFVVACYACNYVIGGTNQQRIMSMWNTRPIEDALRAELAQAKQALEDEQFSNWQTGQALNTAQQEIDELHALNLYDLVGDADQLRQDMVGTIKERDELRQSVDRLRGNIGMEIAKHAWTKAELAQAGVILRRLANITANVGAMFFHEDMSTDWDAALDWIEKHLSYTPEQSERERHREVINGWRLKVKDTEAELAQAREALAEIVRLGGQFGQGQQMARVAAAALGKQEG